MRRGHRIFAFKEKRGILFFLGLSIVVLSSHGHQEDAMKLGATKFVATVETGFEIPLKHTLDLIIVNFVTSSWMIQVSADKLIVHYRCCFWDRAG